MDRNLVYKALYLHYVDGYNINKVAKMTELTPKQIKGIIEGYKYEDVLLDFMEDRKKGNFNRVYEAPKLRKLDSADYESLKNSYFNRMINGVMTLAEAKAYMIEDDMDTKQRERMLKQLDKMYREKIDEILDKKLDAILDVLAKPAKFGIDKDNNIVTVYPHPLLDSANKVIGIEYKPYRSYLMPPELFERYCKRLDKVEAKTDPANVDVKTITTSIVFKWMEMKAKGMTYTAIAKESGVSPTTVTKYIKMMEELQNEQRNK